MVYNEASRTLDVDSSSIGGERSFIAVLHLRVFNKRSEEAFVGIIRTSGHREISFSRVVDREGVSYSTTCPKSITTS